MRLSRSLARSITFAALAVAAAGSSGCAFIGKVIGKDKLNQGVIAYNQGRDQEALALFKSATDYMPDNATAWLYYGAALFKDVRGEQDETIKKQKAEAALQVYNKALEMAGSNCKHRGNAIGYIASIYDTIGDKEKFREWQLKRASDECADKTVKAATYYAIGVGYWQCAYDESTRFADKAKLQAEPFHCRNFYSKPDKDRFDDCLNKGMQYIEQSLSVDPEYTDALSYKSLLLREKQKATCDEAERKKFADEAVAVADKAIALTKKKKEEAEAAAAAAQQASPSPAK
jgi:hypothetical protein